MAVVASGFWAVFGPKPAQAVALGAILVFGVAYLVAQGLADAAPRALTRRTAPGRAGAAALAYFTFHRLAEALAAGALPAPPAPGPLEWALIVLVILSFGAGRGGAGAVPALGAPPGRCGAARASCQRALPQRALDRLIGGLRTAKPRSEGTEQDHVHQAYSDRTGPVTACCAAEAAARAIPPAFPLEATVAVNPFLGQTGEDLARPRRGWRGWQACALTLPRAAYAAAVGGGRDRATPTWQRRWSPCWAAEARGSWPRCRQALADASRHAPTGAAHSR